MNPHYPDAVWQEGDTPPIGARVITTGNRVGTVLGSFRDFHVSSPPHDCPCCTCQPKLPACIDWWVVEIDGWWRDDTGGYTKTPMPRAGQTKMRVLVYPPTLKPLEPKP